MPQIAVSSGIAQGQLIELLVNRQGRSIAVPSSPAAGSNINIVDQAGAEQFSVRFTIESHAPGGNTICGSP